MVKPEEAVMKRFNLDFDTEDASYIFAIGQLYKTTSSKW